MSNRNVYLVEFNGSRAPTETHLIRVAKLIILGDIGHIPNKLQV